MRNFCLNEMLIRKQKLSMDEVFIIQKLHEDREELFDFMEKLDSSSSLDVETLKMCVQNIETLEYALQATWRFEKTRDKHTWWYRAPHCTCPEHRNDNLFGQKARIVSITCPLHHHEVNNMNQSVEEIHNMTIFQCDQVSSSTGKIYPREEMGKAVAKYQEKISENCAHGSRCGNVLGGFFGQFSHKVLSMYINGTGEVKVDIQLLNNSAGHFVCNNINSLQLALDITGEVAQDDTVSDINIITTKWFLQCEVDDYPDTKQPKSLNQRDFFDNK